jgi:uncharacterized UBP type Zn finger protein
MSRREAVLITEPCEHAASVKIREVTRPGAGCEDCMKIGGRWVHLRECLTCGHVGCCDSSPNRHATAHFKSSKHPIVTSVEPGETWVWCYVDESALAE